MEEMNQKVWRSQTGTEENRHVGRRRARENGKKRQEFHRLKISTWNHELWIEKAARERENGPGSEPGAFEGPVFSAVSPDAGRVPRESAHGRSDFIAAGKGHLTPAGNHAASARSANLPIWLKHGSACQSWNVFIRLGQKLCETFTWGGRSCD